MDGQTDVQTDNAQLGVFSSTAFTLLALLLYLVLLVDAAGMPDASHE